MPRADSCAVVVPEDRPSFGERIVSGASVPVPYITAWSGEALPLNLTFAADPESGGLRLSYPDPVDQDWRYGVLRARQGLTRGGQPVWQLVNTLRQWRCMEYRLCQVCGRTAVDADTGRTWWVLADDPEDSDLGMGYANAPPTCRSCIPAAIASCPRLRRGAGVYTVSDCSPYAVLAHTFEPHPEHGATLVERNALVLLEEFRRLTCALSQQLVVILENLRPAHAAANEDLTERCDPHSAPGQWWSRARQGGEARDHRPPRQPGGACDHLRVEWTYQRPLPDGARCRDCDTWWRLDLIPADVAARLTDETASEKNRPCATDRRHS
ncbi:hypothetical protein [Streptosporangium sp. KLBMP 9127]|nr:hypothetical protein [Streptosporangium sp. KLBMP 9127]